MKVSIFLSYGRPDQYKVEEIYDKLKDLGLDPWMDTKNLCPGENWSEAIDDAIKKCDFFLLCLSTSTVTRRGFLQHEIKKALIQVQMKLDSDIYLIPARFDECELPASLREKQWVDLFDKDSWPKLLQAFHEGIKRIGKESHLEPSLPYIDTPERGITPPSHSLSPEEINYIVKLNVKSVALLRKFGIGQLPTTPSTNAEMDFDWHQGVVRFANDVLDGSINFANRIGSDTYWFLESTWLEDVKSLRAYFLWNERGGTSDSDQMTKDYLQASEEIRSMLFRPEHKAHTNKFAEPRQYLENRYLTDGRIDESKPDVQKLVSRKARRIWVVTGDADIAQNWFRAQKYVRMFYENIVPAVVTNDASVVNSFLEAFAFSDASENRSQVIDCFEFALASYFLDIDRIQEFVKRNGSPI